MRKGYVRLAMVLAVAWVLFAHQSVALELKVGSGWEKPITWNDGLFMFMSTLAKDPKGGVTLKWAGGAEVFPPFELHEYLRKGIIDVMNTSTSFCQGAFPEGFFYGITTKTNMEERKLGLYDAMNKLWQKKLNAFYMGRWSGTGGMVIVLKKPIKRLAQLRGMKIRSTPMYTPFFDAVGAVSVNVAPAELYGALEKGLVDGYGWPESGHIERKFYEVAKYYIDHPWGSIPTILTMNLDTWNRLSQEQRKFVMDAVIKTEKDSIPHYSGLVQQERKDLQKLGVQFVKFPEEDAKAFQAAMAKAGRNEYIRLCPQDAPQILSLMDKK